MADAVTRQKEYPSKLQLGGIDPEALKAVSQREAGDKTETLIGAILGVARGVTRRANPNDPGKPAIGFTGYFEGCPADPNGSLKVSEVLYLTGSLTEAIRAAIEGDAPSPVKPGQVLKRGEHVDTLGTEVPLALEIYARKSANDGGAGYEFAIKSAKEIAGADPLAKLRGEMGAKFHALTSGTMSQPAIADASAGKNKTKKK